MGLEIKVSDHTTLHALNVQETRVNKMQNKRTHHHHHCHHQVGDESARSTSVHLFNQHSKLPRSYAVG